MKKISAVLFTALLIALPGTVLGQEKSYVLKDAPKTASDKIVEAIVAEHPGKPVLIDVWATWCGPCLQGMKSMKEIKPELKEHGVVTIYITGETSPKDKWTPMLDDIGGIHYYLTGEQWKAICDTYGIAGIPQYLIFDKSGKKAYQVAGFPGNEKIKEELQKVW